MSIELTTLARVKAWLNVTINDNDETLQALIVSCSQFIETYTKRKFELQPHVENRDGTGGSWMVFSNIPIVSIESVVINGNTVLPSNYTFNSYAVYLSQGTFTRGRNNVIFNYTAGYAVIPSDLEQACIDVVSLRWRERDRIGHQSKSLGGETVTFTIRDFPPQVQTILNTYKKVVPLI